MHGYADKIRQKRIAAGKSEEEMAELIGINLPSYFDLESYDDEVVDCLSLSELRKLYRALDMTPADLFSEEARGSDDAGHLSFAEFSKKVKSHIESHGMTVPEFEDKVGWELESLLNDPAEIWERNVQFLKDVCVEVGINWLWVAPV